MMSRDDVSAACRSLLLQPRDEILVAVVIGRRSRQGSSFSGEPAVILPVLRGADHLDRAWRRCR